jgi:hypothetical protein
MGTGSGSSHLDLNDLKEIPIHPCQVLNGSSTLRSSAHGELHVTRLRSEHLGNQIRAG